MSNKNTNIDEKVLILFNKVKEKQKNIAKTERVDWKTSCVFPFSKNPTDTINLHVESDAERLVDAYAFVSCKEYYYKESANEVGVSVDRWGGYKFSDWKSDIKSRINQLKLSQERKELKALESRLDSLITIEQRREMELEAIEKELKDEIIK